MTAVEGELFPDTRDALFEMIDGQTLAGVTVAAVYHLPQDYADRATTGETPVVLIYTSGGTQGWIDRVDRATVDVYAPGTQAVQVAEAIRALVVGDGHDLDAGYIDSITCDITPHDVPLTAEVVNMARAGYLVTSRPI